MLPDPLQAYFDGATSIDTMNYRIVQMLPTGTVRKINGGAAGGVNTLKISHSVVGKGAYARDRHLVRFEAYGVVDGVEDPNICGAVYVVADMPRSQALSATQRSNLARQVLGTLRGNSVWHADSVPVPATVWDRVLLGES